MRIPSLAVLIAVLSLPPACLGDPPRVADSRLKLDLIATAPAIVTPTGLAVDARGRLFVIESHTHFRPADYDGPPADRIKVFEDADGDGSFERISTFFEGTTHTMALAFAPDGSLVVATRAEVFRLRDRDHDGRADDHPPRESLARLETNGDYPHNGLAGVTIDTDGTITFGMGENLGEPYRLIGADGTTLAGGGEGGNIYRMRPDGSRLERIATGFWNPFGMAFDAFGRLFAVDNDPDARPPCRLLHVVEQGDYGYRFRNGRRGVHPFTSWNGELPGTLPMAAGTGEAPGGLVAYEADRLPEDYRGTLLATSWGDHRIERYRLRPRGASFVSTMEPVVTGGEDFRPVAIAVAPDGSLFFTDWVDKSYTLHGQGRLWRLSAAGAAPNPAAQDDHHEAEKRRALALRTGGPDDLERRLRAAAGDESAEVRGQAVRLLPAGRPELSAIAGADESAEVRAEALRRVVDPAACDLLLAALDSDDPFARQAARVALARSLPVEELLRRAGDPSPARRLGIVLALRDTGRPEARAVVAQALADPDPSVRFVAVEWIGEERLTEFKDALRGTLADSALTRSLFEAALAALERLDGRRRTLAEEVGGQDYIAALVVDPHTAPRVLRRALRSLRPDHPALTLDRLRSLLDSPDPALRLEAVRTMRDAPHAEKAAILAALAADAAQPEALRAEAVAGIRAADAAAIERLVDLACRAENPPAVRRAAARSLRGAALTPAQAGRIADLHDPAIALLLDPRAAAADQPPADDLDAWMHRLEAAGPGDPAEGQRVFFDPNGPGCFRCHRVEGRGGRAGPELTLAAPGLSRRRLVESIVRPGREIAPQFVPWLIAAHDGTIRTGLLVEEAVTGEQTYADATGTTFTIRPEAIAERRPASTSLMPDGLPATMTTEEFRDLLEFLAAAPRP